jgi:DNA invertase Pin-like site-specific DNA recombinase
MKYGYCRVSTKTQAKDGTSLASQRKELENAGASEIYSDAYTGYFVKRPEFDKLLQKMVTGDTIIVTKLDRIARSVKQGIELIDSLLERGISVNVLNLGLINNSTTGKLIRNIMLSFAEFERDMIKDRMLEGRAASGNVGGRPHKYTQKQLHHAMELLKIHSYTQVVSMTGISKSTLLRFHRKIKG